MIDVDKIHPNFTGLIVRKDLSKLVKGNALVPTYVLEYLLGQYCATTDEDSIASGIETVKRILSEHYVNRNQAELVKSKIKEQGRYKIIDRITVALNDKSGVYEASFSNLGLKKIPLDTDYIKEHPKLLTGGVWCILDMEFQFDEDALHSNWVIDSLKPIQISHVNFEEYLEARAGYTKEEWIDFIIQSLGYNPDELTPRNKWFQLVRLISYCENNYNLIELGPKGTGKSHIFSEFSPHGILVSGGEVTLAKLFVNNSSGKLGLVGYWDVVAFDEFAGMGKKTDKTLVDVLKNYMANRSFSRGTEQLTADASMAFVGNTSKSVSYMLKHANLFQDLPDKYQDSAFIDRIHFYIPGWEVNIIRNEMFTDEYGFVVDYLAQVFKHLRFHDYSDQYREHFDLSDTLSTRDKDGINKTVSGLMKIIYPDRNVSKKEIEEVLRFAMEGRKRVKGEIQKIDKTFDPVDFSYTDKASRETQVVRTAEELRYPKFFEQYEPNIRNELQGQETGLSGMSAGDTDSSINTNTSVSGETAGKPPENEPKVTHFTIAENQTGISYYKLFADYLKGARKIEITDPYIRRVWQIRNLVEFIQVILAVKEEGEEVDLHLITDNGDTSKMEIEQHFDKIQDSLINVDVNFSWEIASGKKLHARSITTDTGWKISLDRGLDIFQRFDSGIFSIESVSQEARYCKAFELTYLRNEPFRN